MRTVFRVFLGMFGGFIALIGALFVLVGGADLLSGKEARPGIAVAMILFFLGITILGGWCVKKAVERRVESYPQGSEFEIEQRILALAKMSGGRLTLADAALHCRLGIADCQKALDRMTTQGVVELHVGDDGAFTYVVRSFLPHSVGQGGDSVGPARFRADVGQRRLE